VLVRDLRAEDGPFMRRMMLLAGFPPDRPLPQDAVAMPHVRKFLDGWGRAGDVGVLAVDDGGRRLGAAWARVFEAPLITGEDGDPAAEVAIAVEADARRMGVGTALLDALADRAAAAGHRDLALTVSPRNPAMRLYRRAGFVVHAEDEARAVMRRRLR
jgi:ribosomal-protein-alanine N-acetyltransferase